MANVLPKFVSDLLGENALSGNVGDDTLPICVKNGKLATADNSSYVEYSSGQEGYIKYRNGMIIQWGLPIVGDTYTFPLSFTATDPVVVCLRRTSSTYNITAQCGAYTLGRTQAVFLTDRDGDFGENGVFMIAIGH